MISGFLAQQVGYIDMQRLEDLNCFETYCIFQRGAVQALNMSDRFWFMQLMDHLSSTDLWNQTGEQKGWRTNTVWDQWPGAGDDYTYSLHAENYSDLFGPNYIKELSDWSTHQQTLMLQLFTNSSLFFTFLTISCFPPCCPSQSADLCRGETGDRGGDRDYCSVSCPFC